MNEKTKERYPDLPNYSKWLLWAWGAGIGGTYLFDIWGIVGLVLALTGWLAILIGFEMFHLKAIEKTIDILGNEMTEALNKHIQEKEEGE